MSYTGAKASFNEVAEAYDAARPSYPSALVRRIIEKAGLEQSSRVLEVGAGTGKASVLFARRGYRMLCLEPGIEMSEVARRNLAPFPNARVENSTFEDWPVERGAFDLVFAAQAFHWIDPEAGYPKAAQALKPGGWIALFWNLPADPEDGIHAGVQACYRRIAPDMVRRQEHKPLCQEVAEMRQRMAAFHEYFPWRYVYRFSWRKRYSADAYLALLGTYSDHIALPVEQRERLFSCIRTTLHEQGGSILKRFTAVLAMGRTVGKS